MTAMEQLLGMIDSWKYKAPPELFHAYVTGWGCSQEFAMAGWELFCKVRRSVSKVEIQQYILSRKKAEMEIPELAEKDFMYIDVRGCQRCGGDHSHVLFKKLSNPPDVWKWWSTCPDKLEPILLRTVEMK